MQNLALLIARLAMSLLFILAGFDQLGSYPAATQQLVSHGLPPGLLPPVIALQLLAGVAVLCGMYTRTSAALLAAFTLLAAMLFHSNLVGHAQQIDFLQQIAIGGGLLALAVRGPGSISIDAWRRKRKQRIFY